MNETSSSPSMHAPTRRAWTRPPQVLWAACGALVLTTAALGGALVQRTADHRRAEPAPSALQAQAPVFDGPESTPAQGSTSGAAASVVGRGGQQVASGTRQVCTACGTVESVRAIKVKGKSTGVGVAGGALAGGLLGHQFGGGSGKTVLTIAGAAGGALAGREVERNVRASTAYEVKVRMNDGSVRTLRQSTPLAAGTPVQVQGKKLRLAGVTHPAHAAG